MTTINLRSLQYFCIVVRLQSDNFGSVHSETQQFLMFHHGSLHFSDGLPLSVELIAHATPARSSRWNRTEFLISRSASGSRRESLSENAKNSSRPTNRRTVPPERGIPIILLPLYRAFQSSALQLPFWNIQVALQVVTETPQTAGFLNVVIASRPPEIPSRFTTVVSLMVHTYIRLSRKRMRLENHTTTAFGMILLLHCGRSPVKGVVDSFWKGRR